MIIKLNSCSYCIFLKAQGWVQTKFSYHFITSVLKAALQQRHFKHLSSSGSCAFVIRSWYHWFFSLSWALDGSSKVTENSGKSPESNSSASSRSLSSTFQRQVVKSINFRWQNGEFCQQMLQKKISKMAFCNQAPFHKVGYVEPELRIQKEKPSRFWWLTWSKPGLF